MPGATDTNEIVYRLNERDEVVYVNDAWERFAADNSGGDVRRNQVLSASIWEFIADPTTGRIYRDLLKRVWAGIPVKFTFRCDSPTQRRLLEMKIAAVNNDAVEFRTRILSIEDREPQPIFDAQSPRTDDLVRMCSWCDRVQHGERWTEVEEAVAHSRVFERTRPPMVTHGICSECADRMLKTISPS